MFTVKIRIVAFSVAISGIVLVGFAVAVHDSQERSAVGRFDALLQSHMDRIGNQMEEQYEHKQYLDAEDLLSVRTPDLTVAHLEVYDSTLRPLLPRFSKPSADIPVELIRGSAASEPRVFSTVMVDGRAYRVLWGLPDQIDPPGPLVGIYTPITSVYEDLSRLELLFFIFIPAALVVVGLASYVVVCRAFRPVSSMIRTAREITAADLDRRVELPATEDEIRLLAETFNEMIGRLSRSFNVQKHFIMDASHEFRTPLTIIRSELEFSSRYIEAPEAVDAIAIALGEVDHLASLTRDLLTLVRLDGAQESFTRVPVPLNELVARSIQRMATVASARDIRWQVQVADDAEVCGNEEQLERALLNLLDNAVKYSPAGSTIDVAVENHQEMVSLSVTDNGPGVPEADIPYLFQRFHRAEAHRNHHEGNGLGLAIVRRIVECHNGSVSVANSEGGGATFTIRLPRI